MRTRRRSISMLAVAAIAGAAAWLFGGIALADGPTTADLKMTEQRLAVQRVMVKLADGKGEIPFATSAGKLLFQVDAEKKVRLDSNGDGVIDDKDDPAVVVKGAKFKTTILLAGKPVEYPLAVSGPIGRANAQTLSVGPAAFLEGKLGDQTVRLFDANVNGKFGEAGDTWLLGEGPANAYMASPWCSVVTLDKKLYTAEVAEGPQLKLTSYAGETAQLKIELAAPATAAEGLLREVDNKQVGPFKSGETAVFVPGKYQLANVMLNAGAMMRGKLTGTIELKPGENVIKLGPPFKLDFAAEKQNGKYEITDAGLVGAAGEMYAAQPTNKEESFTALIRSGQQEKEVAKLSYG